MAPMATDEPVVADLNGDGRAEVLFASWAQKDTDRTGKLHILDAQGTVLHEVDLPPPFGAADWNGALAAPTLADLDGDPDLELVLNTAHSGVVAYDLPGTQNARVLWATGRGSFQRSGSLLVAGEGPDIELYLPLVLNWVESRSSRLSE